MPKKIFVIEDNPSHELLLGRLIQSVAPDAEIHYTESAEQALESLEIDGNLGLAYDLIISDIFLAGKATGFDVLQVCREYFPDTPVLLTSSMPLLQFFDAVGLNEIAPTYLAKPFNAGEGRQIIASMLGCG